MDKLRYQTELENAVLSVIAIITLLAIPLYANALYSKIRLHSEIEAPQVVEGPKTHWPLEEDPNIVIPVIDDQQKPLSPSVKMFTRPGCPPCLVWWNVHRPAWEKKGWPVTKEDYSGPRKTPWFVVCDGEKEFEVDWLTYETYKKAGGR